MTAHQRNAVLPEAFREVARLRHVGDAEIIGDVPDGTSMPIKLPEWITGRSFVPWAMPKGNLRDADTATANADLTSPGSKTRV